MADNETEGRRTVRSCKYHTIGCTFKGNEASVDRHENEAGNEHIEILTLHMAKMDLHTVKLETMLQEVTTERDVMVAQIHECNKKVSEISTSLHIRDKAIRQMQRTVSWLVGIMKEERGDGTDPIQPCTCKDDLLCLTSTQMQLQNRLTELEKKGGPQLDRQMALYDIRLAEYDQRFAVMESANYDGELILRVTDYDKRKKDALSGLRLSICSQPFYTSRYGYKMCARIYLNGDGIGKDTHVSFFFVLMRGDHDALLPWPFNQRVTFMLMDQVSGRHSLRDTFLPDSTSSSFQRPQKEMNIATGCPLFVSHDVLEAPGSPYLSKDRTLYFKVMAETGDLDAP